MNAVVFDDDDVFDHLIQMTQDFSIVNRGGHNIIHRIASFRDNKVGESRLNKLSHKTNVKNLINERNNSGQTPLHIAAVWNKHQTIKTLISLGSDVNVRNNNNKLPDEYVWCDDETKRIIRQSR